MSAVRGVAARRGLGRAVLQVSASRLTGDGSSSGPTLSFYLLSSIFCRSEEHTSELQSQSNLVCRLLLENKDYTHRERDLHDDPRRLERVPPLEGGQRQAPADPLRVIRSLRLGQETLRSEPLVRRSRDSE